MKKITKSILSLAMAAGMIVPAAIGSSAAEKELEPAPAYPNLTSTGGCGFIDSNLTFTTGWNVDDLSGLTVEINGNEAYWNNSYLGYQHTGLLKSNKEVEKGQTWLGVVGADLKADDTNTITLSDGTDTYTQTFTSTTNALGTSYAKVTADAKAKTVKAEIVFNTDPGFAVGTEFEGKVHDEHDNKGTFKVTAYDEATKMYTIEAENYSTTHSILELQVTSEGDYKGYFVAATINSMNTKVSDGGVIGDKIAITEATINRTNKPGSNLIDGTSEKVEGSVPSETDPVIIEFKTASAAKLNTLVLYTGGDDADWNNRAPKAMKVYGVAADGTETLLKDIEDSGMQNANFTPFAIDIDATAEFSSYKIVITSRIDREKTANENDWFQLGELEIYSGDVEITTEPVYAQKNGAVEFNGTAPVVDDGNTDDGNTDNGNTDNGNTDNGNTDNGNTDNGNTDNGNTNNGNTDNGNTNNGNTNNDNTNNDKPAKTGDATVFAVVLAVVALAGAAVISKKRSAC